MRGPALLAALTRNLLLRVEKERDKMDCAMAGQPGKNGAVFFKYPVRVSQKSRRAAFLLLIRVMNQLSRRQGLVCLLQANPCLICLQNIQRSLFKYRLIQLQFLFAAVVDVLAVAGKQGVREAQREFVGDTL